MSHVCSNKTANMYFQKGLTIDIFSVWPSFQRNLSSHNLRSKKASRVLLRSISKWLDYLKRLHFYWSTFRCNITLLQSCNIMIESGWLHVVSSSTTLDMIGLLSSRNTTYQDLAEAAVRLLVVLVKKRKKSVLECFFSFAEAAVDAREALLCRLFFAISDKKWWQRIQGA